MVFVGSTKLVDAGATVDKVARPDFDVDLSHRLYLQLLGCTNTCKEKWAKGREWEAHARSAVRMIAPAMSTAA